MTTQTLIGWARACRKQGFHSNLGEIADVLEAQAREIERLEALHVTTMMDELQPALEERDTLRAELAAIRAQAVGEPDGYVLVPVEPTAEMWEAVNKLDDEMAAGGYDGNITAPRCRH